MRKSILLILCFVFFIFFVSGCSTKSSKDLEIENLKKQVDELNAENEKLSNGKSDQNQTAMENSQSTETTGNSSHSKIDLNSAVTVTLIDKKLIPEDTSNGQFDDFVSFSFKIVNNTDKEIMGFRGNGIFQDMFGSVIETLKINFDSKDILPNGTTINTDLGLKVNPFMDSDIKIRDTDLSRIKFVFAPSTIIFKDGTTLGSTN